MTVRPTRSADRGAAGGLVLALVAVVLVPVLAVPGVAAGVPRGLPAPGAAGIGDPLFPRLGSGGYDVLHYTLAFRYVTVRRVVATTLVRARATSALSRFNLDFAGQAVRSVTVSGRPAGWARDGEDLVVTPARPIRARERFEVRIGHVGGPVPLSYEPGVTPWFVTEDGRGSAVMAQPDNAHRIFPSNDHPSDKATFTFRLDVPAGATAVANGDLVRREARLGRAVWTYEMRRPMATELVQVAVGRLDVLNRGRFRGVRLRDVVPRGMTAELRPALRRTDAHLRWLQARLGHYPFRSYGLLVAPGQFSWALETQTLSLFSSGVFTLGLPARFYEPTMVHELAHQWFGDSVSPVRWQDVWLSEGHAVWYQLEYAASRGWLDFDAVMRETYEGSDRLRQRYGPVARPRNGELAELFNDNVYYGGALVLYALRQEVGDADFRRIESSWVSRNRDASVGTAHFMAHASRVVGRDLRSFLVPWLYSLQTPPMPGHPGWTTTDPVLAAR